jgi:DNA-binding transcriptional ArsR family regulator
MHAKTAELFKALGVETRLKIIELLKKKESVGAKKIAQELGITIAAASQHLKILKHIGLVNSKRDGYWIPYSIDEKALEDCSTMMNSVCSCPRHTHFHRFNAINKHDLKEKSIEELEHYREALENRLNFINELLEELREEE